MNSDSSPSGNSLEAASTAGGGGVAQLESRPGSSPAAGKFSLPIPAILLEGDDVETDLLGEDAQKFSLGLNTPAEQLESEGELPEAYGTQTLLLTARDPHWLYAHWDLTREQQLDYCGQSADGHLTLRIHREDLTEQPVAEIKVHPDARYWFVHVELAGARYHAELGCETLSREWIPLATSAAAFTPPGNLSPNTSVEFATIPFETPMATLLSLAGSVAAPSLSLTEALQKLRLQGHPDLPALPSITTWTAAQERALAEVINFQAASHAPPPCSFSITEMIQRSFPESPASPSGISSLFGGVPVEKSFWFNVNAEVIVYGATEPNATVTIGGRIIPLRPDGSFSYRFALPDGRYELPVIAVSADHTDGRAAELKFTRATERRGDIGTHPQDANLKPPAPENV